MKVPNVVFLCHYEKKNTKPIYCLRNWKEYNAALVKSVSLTVWVSEDAIKVWRNHERTGKRGKPLTYSDEAILCMAALE